MVEGSLVGRLTPDARGGVFPLLPTRTALLSEHMES